MASQELVVSHQRRLDSEGSLSPTGWETLKPRGTLGAAKEREIRRLWARAVGEDTWVLLEESGG